MWFPLLFSKSLNPYIFPSSNFLFIWFPTHSDDESETEFEIFDDLIHFY